jgi:hypothetical protein
MLGKGYGLCALESMGRIATQLLVDGVFPALVDALEWLLLADCVEKVGSCRLLEY